MSCRAPFFPQAFGISVQSNYELLKLGDDFLKVNPMFTFMSRKVNGHVFQEAFVHSALHWWDRFLDVLKGVSFNEYNKFLQGGVGTGKVPSVPEFDSESIGDGEAPWEAVWDAPRVDTTVSLNIVKFPHLLSMLKSASVPPGQSGKALCTELDYLTLPVCQKCNAIMDSDAAQRRLLCWAEDPLVPNESIAVTDKNTGEVITLPKPGELDVSKRHRHVLIAYYLHRCLMALDKPTYEALCKWDGLYFYTRMCYLFLMVAAKRVHLGSLCDEGRADYNPRGQLDLYISYASWLLLRYTVPRNNQPFDFYRYHLLYSSETPRCVYAWPSNRPRSLGWYVLPNTGTELSSLELLLQVDTGIHEFIEKVGKFLKGIQCGDEAGLLSLTDSPEKVKTLSDMRTYYVSATEASRLMAMQEHCAGCTRSVDKQNPGQVMQYFGSAPILLPFYHKIWMDAQIRVATFTLLQKFICEEWDTMRVNNSEWLKQKPSGTGGTDYGLETVKIAYNLAFCAELNSKAEEIKKGDPDLGMVRVTNSAARRAVSSSGPGVVTRSAGRSGIPLGAPVGEVTTVPFTRSQASAAAAAAAASGGAASGGAASGGAASASAAPASAAPAPASAAPASTSTTSSTVVPVVDPGDRDKEDVRYLIRKCTRISLVEFLKTTPHCSVWKTSIRLNALRVCTHVHDGADDDCRAFIPDGEEE